MFLCCSTTLVYAGVEKKKINHRLQLNQFMLQNCESFYKLDVIRRHSWHSQKTRKVRFGGK